MKIKSHIIILFLITISTFNMYSQNTRSFTIVSVDKEPVWPAIFTAFKELNLPRPTVEIQEGKGETSFYNYTSLLIKNRLRFKLNYLSDSLTVSIFGRQYLTNSGWVDNTFPMSKKKAEKILNPIKDRIIELTKNISIAGINNNKETNKETNNIKKAGIYEDFVLVRTEDPEMDILAIHKNGNIMGFDLYDDLKTVKTIVSRENNDSEAITMEFNKNGLPIGMGIKNLSFKIESNTNGELLLKLKDQEGNFIGEEKITMNRPPINNSTREFIEDNKNHGPSSFFEFQDNTLNLEYKIEAFSDILGDLSFRFSVVADAIDNLSKGSTISNAVLKDYPKALGKGLILAYAIQKIDPENRFFLNELSTCVPIIVTAITPFVASAIGVTAAAASISTLASVGVILGGLKISYDAWIRLKERHWPTPKIEIIGDRYEIQAGSFGEPGYESLIFHIKTNNPENSIEIYSNEDLIIEKHDLSQNDFVNKENLNEEKKIYCRVYAKESGVYKRWIYASQIIDGEEISVSKEIKVSETTNYYYLKNCNDCSDNPSNKQKCEENLKQCKNEISTNKNIYFVLDENDEIIDSNVESLNEDEAKLNFIKQPSINNKGFKNFVKEAPCAFNCEGLDDKETIISLANEAMHKIQNIEYKIKGLQNVVNETNYSKIGAEIETLKKLINPTKKDYIEKINKIAKKRTISFTTKKTDPAKYYNLNSLKVYGAHWSRPTITILVEVSFTRKHSTKKVETYSGEIKTYLEDLRELRFQYNYKNKPFNTNHTIPISKNKNSSSFGISFKNFERETILVDFKSSLANTSLLN